MPYELSVDAAHLDRAWRMFGPHIRKVKAYERAILGFDGRYLTIEARNVMTHAQAIGYWPGNASVAASTVAALALAPLPGDRVKVTCDGTSVRFGPVKVGCIWQPISAEALDLASVPDWLRGIAIKFSMSRSAIVRDGLADDVQAAERRLAALVTRAAKTLAPIGITEGELQWFVNACLEHRYAPQDGKDDEAETS